MAKKNKPANTQVKKGSAPVSETTNIPQAETQAFSFESFRVQAFIVALLGFIFYCNSFSNEYALDDRALIVQNEYVQQGFSGIPKILTSDAYQSYLAGLNSGNELPGGRYRPLSIVTFAIEQQFFGGPPEEVDTTHGPKPTSLSPAAEAKINHDMHTRHVVNVLLYMLAVVLLLSFLRKVIFPGAPFIAFIATILFTIHPIHTEVVANVKSRDEIMSLIFICATFLYSFRYYDDKKTGTLIKALVCYLLALLSKEFAVTLIILLPLSFYLLRGESIAKSFSRFYLFFIPLAIYGLLRFSAEAHAPEVITADIQNNPYLYATPVQKFASEVVVLLKYLKLLIMPHPLASDYSYRQIPYSDLSSALFWLSLVIYASMVGVMIWLFKKRHILCFALAFYLLNLSLVSNLIVTLGATMGERLIFHSSVGFVMIIAWLLVKAANRFSAGTMRIALPVVLVGIITLLSGYKTITRNSEWKNDRTLFLTDVKTVPNSMLANGNAGSACIDLADGTKDEAEKKARYRQAIQYLNKAMELDKSYINALLNRGVCYYKMGEPDKALADLDTVRARYPRQPSLPYSRSIVSNYYFKQGIENGSHYRNEEAVISFSKAVNANPKEPDSWYNLGYANFASGHYPEAIHALEISLRLKPGFPKAILTLQQAKEKMNK